jgi:hypothetical protein
MLLLVLLASFPEAAPETIRRLARASRTASTATFLRELAASIETKRDRGVYERQVLGELLDALPRTLDSFVVWAPQVARFSFAATKSLS